MCSTPKAPKIQQIPSRAPTLLPDGGDATVRSSARSRRRLSTSAMIFSNQAGTLGAPSVTGPIGTSGL